MNTELWSILAMMVGIVIGAPLGPWLAEKEAEWKSRRMERKAARERIIP